jgi:hypothetical protein
MKWPIVNQVVETSRGVQSVAPYFVAEELCCKNQCPLELSE